MEAALVERATTGRLKPGAVSAGLAEAMAVLEKLRSYYPAVAPFAYRSATGTAILTFRGVVEDSRGRRKTMRQFHCVADRDGNAELVAGLPSEPRPLYNLDLLRSRPDAPVLVVEGEAAANGGAARFPDHVLTTSLNGAGSPHKSDWSSLSGRDVFIWPDNDAAGGDYARRVAAHSLASGARDVRIVAVPEGLPDGWDVADRLPGGLSQDDLQAALAAAPSVAWDQVKGFLRVNRSELHWPPFRLPDGHLARVKHVVNAIKQALERIDSGCHRRDWWSILGCIYHALGQDGLALAVAWSKQGADKHRKFHDGEVERIFEAFALQPQPNTLLLRWLFWRAWREEKAKDPGGDGWFPDDQAVREADLAEFETRHRKLRFGGNVRIGMQQKQQDGSYLIEQLPEDTVRSINKSLNFWDPQVKKRVSIFDYWERNQRIPPLKAVFRPGEEVGPDEFNLFQGFRLRPAKNKGSYALFRALLDRISAENELPNEYLWKLLAYRVQNLHTFVPIVMILIGPQGSFKSTFTTVIRKLLEPYSISISDAENLAGQNNGVLFEKLFVQAEEVELRGDEHNNRFKNYVTNDMIDYKDKYLRQWQGSNRGFIAMTTNTKLPLRVPPDSRRFLVLGVSDPFDGDETKRGDLYSRMHAELEAGGYEALLYDLQHTDLFSFNVRDFPKTPKFRELVEMEVGQEPITAWLRELLEERGASLSGKVWGWVGDVNKDELYSQYSHWSDRNGVTARNATLRKDQWAKRLRELLGGKVESLRLTVNGRRTWFLRFADYEACCRAYEDQLRTKVERAAGLPAATGNISPLPATLQDRRVAEENDPTPF
jgi:hypothetical protein